MGTIIKTLILAALLSFFHLAATQADEFMVYRFNGCTASSLTSAHAGKDKRSYTVMGKCEYVKQTGNEFVKVDSISSKIFATFYRKSGKAQEVIVSSTNTLKLFYENCTADPWLHANASCKLVSFQSGDNTAKGSGYAVPVSRSAQPLVSAQVQKLMNKQAPVIVSPKQGVTLPVGKMIVEVRYSDPDMSDWDASYVYPPGASTVKFFWERWVPQPGGKNGIWVSQPLVASTKNVLHKNEAASGGELVNTKSKGGHWRVRARHAVSGWPWSPYRDFWIDDSAPQLSEELDGAPDLVVEKFWVETIKPGEKLPNGQTAKQIHWYFVWRVRNQGKSPAAASQIMITCKSLHEILPCPGGVNGSYSVPTLWPNSVKVIWQKNPVPDPVPGISVKLQFFATADSANAVKEKNEKNNTLISLFDTQSPPSQNKTVIGKPPENGGMKAGQAPENGGMKAGKAPENGGMKAGNAAAPVPGGMNPIPRSRESNRNVARAANEARQQMASRTPALKVDRISVKGQAQAGRPVSLSVVLRNISRTASRAGQQALSITCRAPRGQTCQVLARSPRVSRAVAPGRASTHNLTGAIKPSGPGTYKVTVVPMGAPRTAGKTVSVRVAQAPRANSNTIRRSVTGNQFGPVKRAP